MRERLGLGSGAEAPDATGVLRGKAIDPHRFSPRRAESSRGGLIRGCRSAGVVLRVRSIGAVVRCALVVWCGAGSGRRKDDQLSRWFLLMRRCAGEFSVGRWDLELYLQHVGEARMQEDANQNRKCVRRRA
jgi:hypothetical protein